jgi:hypothetical protein
VYVPENKKALLIKQWFYLKNEPCAVTSVPEPSSSSFS